MFTRMPAGSCCGMRCTFTRGSPPAAVAKYGLLSWVWWAGAPCGSLLEERVAPSGIATESSYRKVTDLGLALALPIWEALCRLARVASLALTV